MRVIAGFLGGRQFDSPHSRRTHPMSERIRGAIFATLGDIEDLRVLDAFSGSGAIGIEAVSRGAASVVSLENDRQAQQTILANVAKLKIGTRMRLRGISCFTWSQNNPDQKFDLVFVDPPFDDLQYDSVETLADHLSPGGILIVNWPGAHELPRYPNLQMIRHKKYGDAQVGYYQA